MADKSVVDIKEWDDHWETVQIPMEIKRGTSLLLDEILEIFDLYLTKNKNLDILEIGGAPGQYLVYMKKNFNYNISALEFSKFGCKKTIENFDCLKISGNIYEIDLFSDLSDLPRFDIVYSLGFIEHFSNLEIVIKKHLELLKPGGILIIGTPNFLGINGSIMRKISPKRLSKHETSTMDIKNWNKLEGKLGVDPIFKDYIGGFEPKIFSCENKTIFNVILTGCLILIRVVITDRFKFLRKFNNKYFSSYVMGVYRKIE